ncbi:hypothetical protein L218DRAFT_943868 [Marasmius fiardii PR-910]|nr:hypothetical protein L218DRAFT_943868 [Marasmius fiardii PR-910]
MTSPKFHRAFLSTLQLTNRKKSLILGKDRLTPFFIDSHPITIGGSVTGGQQPLPPPTTTHSQPMTPVSTPPQVTQQRTPTPPPQTKSGSASTSQLSTNHASSSGSTSSTANTSSTTKTDSIRTTGVSSIRRTSGTNESGLPPTSATITSGSEPPVGSSASTQSHSPNLSIIVGVILGVIAFIVLLLFTICIYRRKRKIRSTPGILEAFYREKMIKSAERVPEPPPSDLEPLNKARLSVISEVSTHGERSTTDTSIHLSSDIASLQGPDYTIYTITESDSANESYAASEFTSTVEPSEYYYYGGAAPRTDRQMDIEKRIFQLQGQLIDLLDRTRSTDSIPSIPSTIGEVRDRIKKLRELQEGEWAREICDEPPAEMLDH